MDFPLMKNGKRPGSQTEAVSALFWDPKMNPAAIRPAKQFYKAMGSYVCACASQKPWTKSMGNTWR